MVNPAAAAAHAFAQGKTVRFSHSPSETPMDIGWLEQAGVSARSEPPFPLVLAVAAVSVLVLLAGRRRR